MGDFWHPSHRRDKLNSFCLWREAIPGRDVVLGFHVPPSLLIRSAYFMNPMTRPSLIQGALSGAVLLLSILMAGAQSAGKRYCLYDDKPAPLDLKGWESHSFPLGSGHFGVS